jgi:putative membrane protein
MQTFLIGLVAALHFYFLYLEMFAWETAGRRAFKGALPDDLFRPTKTLAANQGLYNGFLAAGLIWSRLISDAVWRDHVAVFFLSCVIVAGIYGAVTASRKILWIQALPAALALGAVLWW